MAGFSAITWTSGVTACSAANMQRYEDFIQQAEGDSGSVVLSGATSGTATLYQTMQGTYKKVVIWLSGFRNTGGSTQTVTLPTAFTLGCAVRTGSLYQIELQISGGTAQSIDVLT